MREQLEAIEKRTGRHDEQLDSVSIPEGFEYLWSIFFDLRSGLAPGFSGAKVTWRDLLDYQEVTGYHLSAWEIEAIRTMDGAIAKWLAERRET